MDKERMAEFAKELVKEAEKIAEELKAAHPKTEFDSLRERLKNGQKPSNPEPGSFADLVSKYFDNYAPTPNPAQEAERLNALLPALFAATLELSLEEQIVALWFGQWNLCSRVPGWLTLQEEAVALREKAKQEASKE